MGGHIDYALSVHTFNTLVPREKYFPEHPEYFSELNGKRSSRQLCMSNPEVTALVIAHAKDILKEDPEANIISVSPNDDTGYCACPQCKALTEAEGSPSGPLLQFVNAVAAGLAADYPQVKVSTLAYRGTVMPPKTIRPRDNVVIQLCTDSHALLEPFLLVTETEKFRHAMETWSAIGARTYIWDYTVNFGHLLAPMPNLPVVAPDIRYYVAHGASGVMLEGAYQGPGAADARMKTWVWAKQLWNPELDTRALMHDFVYGYFGEAAEPMWQYQELLWQIWEQQHTTTLKGIGGGSNYPATATFLSPDFLHRAGVCFTRAEQLAVRPATRSRIQMEKLAYLYTLLVQGVHEEHDLPTYQQALDEFTDLAAEQHVVYLAEGTLGLEKFLLGCQGAANRFRVKAETPGTRIAEENEWNLASYLGAEMVKDDLAGNTVAVRQPGTMSSGPSSGPSPAAS